jgi:hypothetical protein
MKRIATLVLAAGAALTLTAATADAQSQVRAHVGPYFGVGAGLAIPTGDFGDVAGTGWNALAQIGYEMASGLGVRGDFYYGQHSADPGDGKFKFAGGLGNVTYTFRSEGKLHPYIVGTIGMMNGKFEDFDGETDVAFGGGAGIIYHTGEDSNFFLEGRYLSINSDPSSVNLIPIQIGIRFGI